MLGKGLHMAKNNLKRIHQMTFAQWEAAFPDERSCAAYLAMHRWKEGVRCPRCGNTECKPHGTMEFNWLCNKCSPTSTNYRFSVIAGTIFASPKLPLRTWFHAMYQATQTKQGISSLELGRRLGVSQTTEWERQAQAQTGLME